MQDAVFLNVAPAALRTAHDAIRVRRWQAVSMTAHPAFAFGGHAQHQRIIRHVAAHHRPCADEGITPYRPAAHNGGIGADGRATFDQRAPVFGFAIDLRTGIDHVCEHTGRTEKDIILHDHAGIHRNVVLDFDVIPDHHVAGDHHVLPHGTIPADPCIRHDVAEMPDARALPDLTRQVNITRWVDEIGQLVHRSFRFQERMRHRIQRREFGLADAIS